MTCVVRLHVSLNLTDTQGAMPSTAQQKELIPWQLHCNVSPRLTTMEVSMKLQQSSKELIASVLTDIHCDASDISVSDDVPYEKALSKVFHELWTKLEAAS